MKKHRVIQLGLIVLIGLWADSGDCADRGLDFSHKGHFEQKKMKCTDCHGMGPAQRSMPNHQLCSICHETDKDAEDVLDCAFCHTRADNAVDDLVKLLADEVKFDHEPHREKKCADCHPGGEKKKEMMPDDPAESMPPMPTCDLCHPDPDSARLSADPVMPLCVECHQKMGESRSECAICHNTITREARQEVRPGTRFELGEERDWTP